MQKEIWKDVKGYEGKYQVSNLGNVKSLSRVIIKSGYSFISKEIILSPYINKLGYKRVNLYKNNNQNVQLVARLVAQAFLNYNLTNKGLVVDHIDNNKSNNNINNLQVITQRANCSKKERNNVSSKYVGVYFNNTVKKWTSVIATGKKKTHLGHFNKEIDAANAYQEALKNL